MPKKIVDLDNKDHLNVNRINDLVHVHTAGRDIGGVTDFSIGFLDLFDYGQVASGAYLYKTNTQSITGNTWIEIAWTTTKYDTDSYVNPDDSGFIIPYPGFYLVYGGVERDTPSGGYYDQIRILADGTYPRGSIFMWDGLQSWLRMPQIHYMAYFEAGVELTLSMYLLSQTRNTYGGEDQTQFSILRLGGG